jgi:hypothetical protein
MDMDYTGIIYTYTSLDHGPDCPIQRERFQGIQTCFFSEAGWPSEVDENIIPDIIDDLVDIRIQDAMIRHKQEN